MARKKNNFDPSDIGSFGLEVERKAVFLKNRFVLPPFTVLDTKSADWQKRKKAWLSLGIESELGRGNAEGGKDEEALLFKSQAGLNAIMGGKGFSTGTSIFDPVLCELCYKWFCPEGGSILDPFAGGSVRGVVASYAGYMYTGIDLRAEQVEANRKQWSDIGSVDFDAPVWHVGDALRCHTIAPGSYDMVFSCPPYGDLEVYSDDPADLSNMEYADFVQTYARIIKRACRMLKDNRFACFVVGEIRDKKGMYRNFVGDTINAFTSAGLNYYNEAILLTAIGTLPVRIGRQFTAGRKLGKAHQNVLVFYKGNDHSKIKELFEEKDNDAD